jgi:molybdate transport system ATP-binding protein
VVTLKNINFSMGRKNLLLNINAEISRGECWVITGGNGSGKSLLGRIIMGSLEPTSGHRRAEGTLGYAAFELQESVMAEERRRDDSRYFDGDGAENPGRTVTEWMGENLHKTGADSLPHLINQLGLERVADRGLRYLSTGEFRKAMIGRALLEESDMLVLDDPYDGLDEKACQTVRSIVEEQINQGRTVIFISGRREDFPSLTTNMIVMERGEITYKGDYREEYLQSEIVETVPMPYESRGKEENHDPVIMRQVNLSYGDKKILNNLNWHVKRGDKWLLTGPNGAGKSTLLSLINGDNPKAFGQDITLFGRKKGTGESVWEIKHRIGHISGDFQLNYRVRSSVLGVVLSGYFDSIGLYHNVNEQQKKQAAAWLDFCGLSHRAKESFEALSFGEKRMVLIARSLIKSPELLILDEPCQGLDDTHRDRILDLCNRIGEHEELTMLYVTHSAHNTPACLTKHIQLIPSEDKGYTGSQKIQNSLK